jgi:type IV secretion system protein VirD4
MTLRGNITPAMVFAAIVGIGLAYTLNHIAGAIEPMVITGNIAALGGADDFIGRSFVEHPTLYTSSFALGAGAFGLVLGVVIYVWQSWYLQNNKMSGREHGSAKILPAKSLKNFSDAKSTQNNILLAKDVSMRFLGRRANDVYGQYDRNNNIIVVGGSGSGKTRHFVLPNLMQLNSSYVHTDPKGGTVKKIAKFLLREGYKVKILNTVDFSKSMHFNPLSYIYKQSDILRIVNVIMSATSGHENNTGDPFWPKAEKTYFTALIALLWEWCLPSEQNIPNLIELFSLAEVHEDDSSKTSCLDELFEVYKEELTAAGKDPRSSFAVRQYSLFEGKSPRTLGSVLMSCNARLAPFDLDEVRDLMSYDELDLEMVGKEKTYLGVIMDDGEDMFGFVIAMMEYLLINILRHQADENVNNELDVPVQLILDEFRNIGRIPNIDIFISTLRERQISLIILLQSLSQLHELYKDSADTIIDCCDTFVYLGGGRSKTTAEAISGYVGQSTIETKNMSESRGGSGGNSVSHQMIGRAAIDPAEVSKMSKSECLVIITGSDVARVTKYTYNTHENYSKTGYADPKIIYLLGDEKIHEAEHYFDGVSPGEEFRDVA